MENEKRLDLIDRNELLPNGVFYVSSENPMASLDELLNRIANATTVDAVKVPCRCKECKYWKHYDHLGCTDFVKVCTLAYYMIGENGYCLYGERKDNGC